MKKRKNTGTISSIGPQDALDDKKMVPLDGKKQSKLHPFRIAIVTLSLFILLVGMLLKMPQLNDSTIDTDLLLRNDKKVAAFMKWFRAGGGNVSDQIEIQTFLQMGRGVIALKAVKINDELLFVPKKLIICYDTIAQEWSSQSELTKTLRMMASDQEELLTAFLLLEQAKGKESRWAPYLQLLPSYFSQAEVGTPLLFANKRDIETLQDERMIEATRNERRQAEKAHDRFKRQFRTFVNQDALKLSRYVWARFLVSSRAFSVRGQRILVPFGDIFNGKPDDEAREHKNGQRFLDFHDMNSKGMAIRADRDTQFGEQLFEDYGDNSNYVYFLHHGFLMEDRGFDCAAFRLPLLAEAFAQNEQNEEQILASKLQILSRIKVQDGPLACVSRAGKLEDPGLVRIYLALYHMDARQLSVCSTAVKFSECFPPEQMPNLDDESGRQELSLLLDAIVQQQKHYPTTLEEDLAMIHDTAIPSFNQHAVHFRISRKQILRDAQAALKQQVVDFDTRTKVDADDDLLRSSNEVGHAASNKLERFEQWIARHHFPVNYLKLRYISEAVGYGTFAAKTLTRGEVYLKVPVEVVMNIQSALKSRWVRQVVREFKSQQADVPGEEMLLLLHLLEEKFGPKRNESWWMPYLDMLPALRDQDNTTTLPLFYAEDEEELKALKGTDLLPLVMQYRQQIAQSYAALHNYLKRSVYNGALEWLTESRFRWANAVLDSRSIWWNNERHLVPLLDMVNCQELGLTQQPHYTNLDASGRHAVTKASWKFEAGQEVVENYAQPNYIYLLYHGFVLDSNSHDCAQFHLEVPVLARRDAFLTLLRRLEVYSWTIDICVSPNQNVNRFLGIALLVSEPNEAVQLLSTALDSALSMPSEAISSALNLVDNRLNRLKSSEPKDSLKTLKTHSIHQYRHQQLRLLVALRQQLESKHS